MSRTKKTAFILITILGLNMQNGWAENPLTKMSRGIENFLTSPAEFPAQYIGLNNQGRSLVETVLLGTIYGAFWTVARAAGGCIEFATFLIPVPEDYKPLMDPATPFDVLRRQATASEAKQNAILAEKKKQPFSSELS